MPSTEAKSLINSLSGAAWRVEQTIKEYSDTELPNDLPTAFPVVLKWLPAVRKMFEPLSAIVKGVKPDQETQEIKDSYKQMTKSLEVCGTLAGRVQEFFNSIAAEEDKDVAARLERYRQKVEEEGGERVEKVMKEILERVLEVSKALHLSDAEITELQEALKEVKSLPASLEEKSRSGNYTFTNYNGVQPIYLGKKGNQIIGTGNGPQINGDASHAQFHFGSDGNNLK